MRDENKLLNLNLHCLNTGPCWPENGGCVGLCIPKEDNTAECRCDFGTVLQADGKSCESGSFHFTIMCILI